MGSQSRLLHAQRAKILPPLVLRLLSGSQYWPGQSSKERFFLGVFSYIPRTKDAFTFRLIRGAEKFTQSEATFPKQIPIVRA